MAESPAGVVYQTGSPPGAAYPTANSPGTAYSIAATSPAATQGSTTSLGAALQSIPPGAEQSTNEWNPLSPTASGTLVACSSVPPPSAASSRGADVSGVRLGMTRDEVVAACCATPRKTVYEHRAAIDKTGQETNPPADSAQLAEPAYLSSITCGGVSGVLDIGFSPPPALARVVRVNDKISVDATQTTAERYAEDLTARYGEPVDHVQRTSSNGYGSTVTYKWLFRQDKSDLDCAPRSVSGRTFTPHLPGPGRCATQLVVKIGSHSSGVVAGDFQLINVREVADRIDQHIAFLNKTVGLKMQEGATVAAFSQPLTPDLVDTSSDRGMQSGLLPGDEHR
jgi:hypothetical protein